MMKTRLRLFSSAHVRGLGLSLVLLWSALPMAACESAEVGLPAPGPKAQSLTINATPAGASIIVDGVRVGNAPQTVKLNPGPHRVKAMLSGYFPAEQKVIVSSGEAPAPIALTLVASH